MPFYYFLLLKMAESLCKQQGLDGVRLQECIFDVAITNDTTLAQQESYQAGMISNCEIPQFPMDESRLSHAMLWKGTLRK